MSGKIIDIVEFKSRYSYDPKTDQLFSEKSLSVFKAKDTSTGEDVVVQIFQGPGIDHEEFLEESAKVLNYHHPNLARHIIFLVIKTENFFGEKTHSLVSVHEYIDGINLRQWMEHDHGGMKDLDAILMGILNGLAYLHSQGFAHGNLLPDNIILEETEEGMIPRLINYGYSKLFHAKKTSSGNLLLGTGQYMPPEKILSRSSSGQLMTNSDLWAFGVILYEILAGHSPFGSKKEGHTLAYIFDKIINHKVIPDTVDFPSPYREMIAGCLRKDPEERVKGTEHLIAIFSPQALISETPEGEQDSSGTSIPVENEENPPTDFARVIFLGEFHAGKSTLIERITGHKAEGNKAESGISITKSVVRIDEKHIQTHYWDFSGDEILHNTHRFFLSPRSLYVMIWKPEPDRDTRKLEAWLSTIQSFGKGAPVILVLNQISGEATGVDTRQFRYKFPEITDVIEIPVEDQPDTQKLTLAINRQIRKMEHIADALPEKWLRVEYEISGRDDDFIDYGEFRKICQKHGLNTSEQEQISLFLHDQGLVLHFKDEAALKGTSILKPDWITGGVNTIMHAPQLEKQKGLISLDDLDEILDGERYPPEKHFVLMELMHKFQMCFPVGDKRNFYLVPALLPEEKPEYFWPEKDDLRFRFQYNFLPRSLFPRFIVKARKYTEGTTVWRTGIVLFDQETRAEVILNHEARAIDISLSGNNAERFLTTLRRKFIEIHEQLGKEEVTQLIPCNCTSCVSGAAPYYHSFEELQSYISNRLDKVVCRYSFTQVSVSDLLGTHSQPQQVVPFLPEPEKDDHNHDNTFLGYVAKNAKDSKARTILFLAANPSETANLQLARECRDIDHGLQLAAHRMEFNLEQKWAVTARDFRRALMKYKPEFLHFSGHGTTSNRIEEDAGLRSLSWDEDEAGGLIFEAEGRPGKGQIVSSSALKSIFKLFKEVKCVLLNACYSRNQAEAIAEHIDFVIGMRYPIHDKSAIAFAVSFYDAIGAGESIPFAFEYACSAIELEGLPGADVPVLLKKFKR